MLDQRLKILQINACCDYKSTGVIVKSIGDLAVENGMDMYYAYQTCINKPKTGYQIGNTFDWKFHALYARLTGKEGYASKRATKKFIKWIEKTNPDVVHFHNLHSHYININLICDYLSKKNIPTVITLHDCWYFTGKCSHYVAVGCDSWKESCGNCPLLKAEVPSWFFDPTKKVLLDRMKHLNSIKNLYIVGCSRWITEESKKSQLRPMNICAITNGVDLEIFKPCESSIKTKYNIDGNFIVMGMADKWSDPANEAAIEYISKGIDEHTIITVVGCNDSQKTYFKRFKNIIPIGYITDRRELAQIYFAADVFVNLTHADTLPTVNMESIACGTPVITYDCCGSPELVHEDCGYIVPENDYVSILEKLNDIKNTPCTGMAKARTLFDKTKNYQEYISLYKKAVSDKK